MDPLQWSFAGMTADQVIANALNNTHRTAVAGGDTTASYSKFPLLNESAVSLLVATTIPNFASVDPCVEPPSGKRGPLGNRKNLKNPKQPKQHTVVRSGHRVGKSKKRKKKKAAAAATSSGSGKQPRLTKAQKRENEQRRRDRQSIERKEWLESWLEAESKRRGEEAMDGLVGLMDGFGVGEKVQEMATVEGAWEGVMDMGELEMQMATMEVGGEIS